MQLRKAARKAQSDGSKHKLVKLGNFNPTLPKGWEIAAAHTVHNLSGATHVIAVMRPRV